eukprot:5024189-Heterocapsa_arctica.AAC.1
MPCAGAPPADHVFCSEDFGGRRPALDRSSCARLQGRDWNTHFHSRLQASLPEAGGLVRYDCRLRGPPRRPTA